MHSHALPDSENAAGHYGHRHATITWQRLDPASPFRSGIQPDRAAHSRSAKPAIAIWVLGEILLVIVLGVIERGRRVKDLRGDVAITGCGQLLLVGIAAGNGRVVLRLRAAVDRRAVLRLSLIHI